MLMHRATAIAVVDIYQVASTWDTTFDMPILACCHDKISRVIIAANVSNIILNVGHSLKHILQAIKFEVNVQHDCRLAKCSATGTCPWVQERTDSEAMEQFIVHEPIDHYLINTHSFHNADLLWETLPNFWLHHNRYSMIERQSTMNLLHCFTFPRAREGTSWRHNGRLNRLKHRREFPVKIQRNARQLPLHNLLQFIFEEQ